MGMCGCHGALGSPRALLGLALGSGSASEVRVIKEQPAPSPLSIHGLEKMVEPFSRLIIRWDAFIYTSRELQVLAP